MGEGVRELAHAPAWAPWPVTCVAYISTGSSCMGGSAVPRRAQYSAGKGYLKGRVALGHGARSWAQAFEGLSYFERVAMDFFK